jgi:large subunit ribosomal protein L10
MSKRLKDSITEAYKHEYTGIQDACLVSLVGMDGVATNRLRGRLRKKNIRLHVLRNRLAKRAFAGTPLEGLAKGFQGSCALVHGGESAVDIAKTLVDVAKEFTALGLMAGMIEGDRELIPVVKLAKLKGRAELVGEVAMLISSPGRSLAGALAGAGGRIAGCLKAIAEKE